MNWFNIRVEIPVRRHIKKTELPFTRFSQKQISAWMGWTMLIMGGLMPLAIPTHAQTPEARLKNISQQLEENNKELREKKQIKQKEESSLGSIFRELRYTEMRLENTKKNLVHVQSRMAKSEASIQEKKAELEERIEALKARIVVIHQNENAGYLELFFAPDEFETLADSHYFFEKVMESDVAFIEEINQKYKALKKEQALLANQKSKMVQLKNEIALKEQYLARQKLRKQDAISNLQDEIKRIEKENRELEKASTQIAKLILESGQGRNQYYAIGSFEKPVNGWLSSTFGPRFHPIFKRKINHNGVDYAAPHGYKIRASNAGVVIVAGAKPEYYGYGKITIIDHGPRPADRQRVSSVYAHQSRVLVKEGDFVEKGEEIGWVGATGFATGPHLHFEIRLNGTPVNPLTFMK